MSSNQEFDPRKGIRSARRVVVKVGTAIVTHEDGTLAMGRIGHIVEQISRLLAQGKEVVLVSSGSVGLGQRRLHQQALLSSTIRSHINPQHSVSSHDLRACAAAGQAGLMVLYEVMFRNFDIQCAQVLVTDDDFIRDVAKQNFVNTISYLVAHRIVPIINENDVVSLRATPLRDENNMIFWDNDSLATLVGSEWGADAIVLLTDVEGLYTSNPNNPTNGEEPEIIDLFTPSHSFSTSGKSRVGRGGMQAKVAAALNAVQRGVKHVVIASGKRPHVVDQVLKGEKVGTLFMKDPPTSPVALSPAALARAARRASRALLTLTTEERANVLRAIADEIQRQTAAILQANEMDVQQNAHIAPQMLARLRLTPAKIHTLCDGLRQVADMDEPLNKVLRHTELADGLVLKQITAPIGVLLVIFESRPDVLPQVAALALKTGNALILKGGKEATHSNKALHAIVTNTISKATNNRVAADVIALVHGRDTVASLVKLSKDIDLVIPRGSKQLVESIRASTSIPVLGHADGVCHVYVDKDADERKALGVVVDSKCDYPSACNAAETVLLHRDMAPHFLPKLVQALEEQKVRVHVGRQAGEMLPRYPQAPSMSHEYGDLAVTIEVVDSLKAAVAHINQHSSSHTDTIVTENAEAAALFLQQVDSASVFHNASTRFADGFRFGLGAEVGISTSRIHARGPVGVDGLLTTKFLLRSSNSNGDVVAEFAKGNRKFVHRNLLQSKL